MAAAGRLVAAALALATVAVAAAGVDTSTEPNPTSDAAKVWRPAAGTSWQIQLSGRLDTTVRARVYEVDGFDTSARTIARLHANGRRVVCYISAGSWERWRPDAQRFPRTVLGRSNGWPGERWLDIRRLDVLAPIMRSRLDMCKKKGFDALDPDNLDAYANSSGFRLTAADQLRYNRWLARAAHRRGLSVGLKNDLDQVAQLVKYFDFAVNEQCMEYAECRALQPFVKAKKAVVHIEYKPDARAVCRREPSGFSSLRKRLRLDAYVVACR